MPAQKTVLRKARMLSPKQLAVRRALELTWLIKGSLKSDRMSYLRVGKLLTTALEEKTFAVLHHPDLESYAAERLHLSKRSLYRYLRVYHWVKEYHPEWLEKHPQGFIPDLSDAADLIWIEERLAGKDLSPVDRAALEALREKGLEGKLHRNDLAKYRKEHQTGAEGLAELLKILRKALQVAQRVKSTPPEIIASLQSSIEMAQHEVVQHRAGLHFLDQ